MLLVEEEEHWSSLVEEEEHWSSLVEEEEHWSSFTKILILRLQTFSNLLRRGVFRRLIPKLTLMISTIYLYSISILSYLNDWPSIFTKNKKKKKKNGFEFFWNWLRDKKRMSLFHWLINNCVINQDRCVHIQKEEWKEVFVSIRSCL